MPLSHFSEDSTIARFMPRSPLARPEVEPLVWAIDDWHAPVYFFPHDCPRACFWPLPTTTPEDAARWFAAVPGRMVIAIESAWLERLRATRLYHRYRMPEETFVDTYDHGVHVSRELVVPLSVEPVGDLLAALTDAGVELRITPSLSIAMERGPGGEVSQELLADASHGLYGSPALGPVRKVSPPSVSGTSSSSR